MYGFVRDISTILGAVQFARIQRALASTYRDLNRHHVFQVSAALSYYFVLSIFPGLIVLSALFAFLPLPDLFARVLLLMGRLLPAETMSIVYSVLSDVFSSHRGGWLSIGTLGILWTVSSAFDAMIEALDIAYDAPDQRPLWKIRLLALGLAAMTGGLLLSALALMIVGPTFGDWLAAEFAVPALFAAIWPALRWIVTFAFTILAIELLYFVAPNVKQRFAATLPGAMVSVFAWDALSFLLAIYFRHFADFNRTYGALGGLIALMVWLYWTSFVLVMGAELNAELAKESGQGSLQPKSSATEQSDRRKAERRVYRAA